MRTSKIGRIVAVAGVCAAVGASAAVVGNAASAPSSSAAAAKPAKAGAKNGRGPMRALRRAVHADAVVPTKDGRFVTVTMDRGIVQSVSGDQLTLKEGTKKATYKTVTLTIPANAVVRLNRRAAKLSDVKSGQRATVVRGAKRTGVIVRDAKKS